MSQSPATPGSAQALVELRRARILAAVSSRPAPASRPRAPSPEAQVRFFLREAEELYWNELAWEQMTDEEIIAGGHLTELVFPGFLALIDGLLQEQASGLERVSPRSYPDVVEEVLTFLGERCATLAAELQAGADSQQVIWARAMTLRLIDLVLYRLYRLTAAEREEVEADE
jgi:hypothetical protein